jgi:hypothetical protein
MREMRWTWDELQGTPIAVRAYCWDFIQMERQVAAERAVDRERARGDESGTIRVAR